MSSTYRRDARRSKRRNKAAPPTTSEPARARGGPTYAMKSDEPPTTTQTKEQSLSAAVAAARQSAKAARHYAQYGTMAPVPSSVEDEAPLTSPVRQGHPQITVSPPTKHHRHEEETPAVVRPRPNYQPPRTGGRTGSIPLPVKRVVRAPPTTTAVPVPHRGGPRLPPPRSTKATKAKASKSTTNTNLMRRNSNTPSLAAKSQQIADLLARASSLRNDSQSLLQERQEKRQQQQQQQQQPQQRQLQLVPAATTAKNTVNNSIYNNNNNYANPAAAAAPPTSPSAPSTLSTSQDVFRNIQTAANKGNDGAQFQMGLTYEKGLHGQTIDYVESIRWYSLSAAQNNSRSLCNLGRMYQLGHGEKSVMRKGYAWHGFNVLISLDVSLLSLFSLFSLCLFLLALLSLLFFSLFKGVEPDDAVAVRYFQKGTTKHLDKTSRQNI